MLPTKHLGLIFNSSTLPALIEAACLSGAVLLYIPNSLRCLQCQPYGHSKTSCHESVTCAHCTEVDNDSKSYENPKHCASWQGNQATYCCSCPNLIREKEILTVKITKNLFILKHANM